MSDQDIEKRGAGKPAHRPDERSRTQVSMMAAVGIQRPIIAAVQGICENTLRKHYAHELEVALPKMLAQVGQALYKHALGNGPQAVTAAIFIMKTRGGWAAAKEPEPTETPVDAAMTSAQRIRAALAEIEAKTDGPVNTTMDDSETASDPTQLLDEPA